LSGGLDSSILAFLLRPKQTFTIGWDSQAPDLPYARLVSQKYSENHAEFTLKDDENLSRLLKGVIKNLKTFSPIEVRNSCVVYAGLLHAKEYGYKDIMTGDGCDELFAGYNYLDRYFKKVNELDRELRRLWHIMHFSSVSLGRTLGIGVKTPYLDKEFLGYAKSIDPGLKIGEFSGKTWGKFVLRMCFEKGLGPDIAWREKLAQEEGAATMNLKNLAENHINQSRFRSRAGEVLKEGVNVRDKEQLYYYDIFRTYFCPPGEEDCTDIRCHGCSGCISTSRNYCRTCGAFVSRA
jgi:asparagine synthase (glutamine-hydrolysing)